MFNRNKQKLRHAYDDALLDTINEAKIGWDHARQTELAVDEADPELTAMTLVAKQRYLALYREARLRDVHGVLSQAAIFRD